IDPYLAPGDEGDSFRAELVEPPFDVRLLQLEVRNAVPEQATDPIAALVHGDVVAGPGQLLRGGQPGRPRAHHGDPAACRVWSGKGNQTRLGDPVGDLDLDLFDGDWTVGDAEHARRLARGRAEPAGELGKVVGRVERVGGVRPSVCTDQIVPGRDDVP